MNKLIYTIGLLALVFNINAQEVLNKQPIFSGVQKLPSEINTEGEEVKPVFNEDGNIMYFVRTKSPENASFDKFPDNEDIWEAIHDENGNWKKAEHETSINDEKNNSIIGLGKENHYFLLNTYQTNKHLKYGIAHTRKLAEHDWTKPEIIEIPNLKYQGDFYDFYINKDEDILLISIQTNDSYGKEDLYVSLKENGNWSDPKNLGKTINSEGFEMSPFMTPDTKHLYFSTDGRADGLGDADIYVSERLDDTWTNWSEPKNLGSKVNSPKMDCYFTMNAINEYYFSSNRDADHLDIYQALELKEYNVNFKLVVSEFDSLSNNPLKSSDVNIEFNDLANSKVSGKTNKYGEYTYSLGMVEENTKLSFPVQIAKQGYESKASDLNCTIVSDTTILISATINKIVKPVVKPEPAEELIVLKKVYHDFDKSTHSGGTKANIDDVIAKMKGNSWLKIIVESHTDSKGSEEYNMKLSERRASSAKTYLIRKGISGSRIKTKGYGESKPAEPNTKPDGTDNEEGRAMNRRTEFIINSKK